MNNNVERQFKRYRRQQNEINKELIEQIQLLRETVNNLTMELNKPVYIPKPITEPRQQQQKTDWTEIIYSTIFGIVMYFMFKKILFTLLITGGRPVLS